MADVHLFSGDSASDEDFQSEIMAKWNRKFQEKFEKEKKQIRRKRKKNPLSTQAPNPKIPSKASSPSSGGGGGGLLYSQKCTSLPAEGPSGFKFGDFEDADVPCSSHSIGDLVGIYSKNPGNKLPLRHWGFEINYHKNILFERKTISSYSILWSSFLYGGSK